MAANYYEKGLQMISDYQNNMLENYQKIFSNFDLKKNYEEALEKQEKLAKGIQILVDLKDEDVQSDMTAKDEVLSIGKMKLYHYKPTVPASKLSKTPLLIAYALVNRQYMMDIQPDKSVIKSFLDGGLDVYVIDWGYPTKEDMYLSLDDHINWYMDDCVDYIRKAHGVDKINLLGVCQGGTFSTIYTATHQEKIQNLVTMVVPIDFSVDDALLFKWSKYMNINSLVDAYGVVPGDVMNLAYLILKPLELTMDKYVNMIDKMDDKEFLVNFMRMEKWVFDSPDQAGATLSQFINDMYKGNKLIKGELVLGDYEVNLKNITCPLYCVCAELDHLVPLDASRPLLDAVGSKDKEFISFKTGHIGMYVSSASQKSIAPKIVEWIKKRSK